MRAEDWIKTFLKTLLKLTSEVFLNVLKQGSYKSLRKALRKIECLIQRENLWTNEGKGL